MSGTRWFFFLLAGLTALPVWAEEGKWSGNITSELLFFPENPLFSEQQSLYPSLSTQPEYYRTWDNGKQSFTLTSFLRLDPQDKERTHADLREFTWRMTDGPWEMRLGIRKLFWGVTESQHLVDIVNQTDSVENFDGDEKLGQPMANLSYTADLGTLDLFVLPYFRERTFPGPKGRPRTALLVDTDQTRFESSAQEYHPDWAVRWFQTIDNWDVGLSHFSGTGREPLLVKSTSGNNTVLTPYYVQIDQTGLDLQTTQNGWLLKAEWISRELLGERYSAGTAGFEYTVVGLLDSETDLGILGEYLWDDRHENATTPFSDDVMVGLRLTLNDVQSTDFLLGSIIDPDSKVMAWKLEGHRRLWENWKLSIEGRAFVHVPDPDLLSSWRRDSLLRVEMARYF